MRRDRENTGEITAHAAVHAGVRSVSIDARRNQTQFPGRLKMTMSVTLFMRSAIVALATLTSFHGQAAAQSNDMTVSVAAARRDCFSDTLQVSGVLVPRNEVLVRPSREGMQVFEILVEPGDSVVAGQVLARLAPPDGQGGRGASVAVQTPVAGNVVSQNLVIGALASASGPPLFRIAGNGEMELLAEAPGKALAGVRADQLAKVEIVGAGEMPGKVRLVSGTINTATQLAQVRILLGSDARLRAGVFGLATIDLGKRRCGPAVPLSAVLFGSEGAVVQVVRDNRIQTRRVSVGQIATGQAEIREGLTVGDVVVARAGSFVRDGDRIKASSPQ
jgi:HlyD family secretion protein